MIHYLSPLVDLPNLCTPKRVSQSKYVLFKRTIPILLKDPETLTPELEHSDF